MSKKHILWAIGLIVALTWVSVFAALLLGAGKPALVITLSIAAVATEAAFWSVAAVTGVAVYQARAKIWAGVKSFVGLGRAEA